MKIVVDVVNGEKVKQLTEEIKKQEAEIIKWNSAMATAGPKQQAALQTAMTSAAMSIQAANAQLKEIPQTAAQSGRALGQLAYAVDDLQYGFTAIVNNIPGIVMGLGGGAGIAGAAGIAAVAINQLIKHSGDLADAFNAWQSGRPAEVLREIREQAEAATEALEKMSKFTEKEEKIAGNVGKAIQNSPKDKFIAEVMDAFGPDEKKIERYKKYYEAKSWVGIPAGMENQAEQDLRVLKAEKSAKDAEEQERRERAEKLVGKALLPGRAGQEGLKDLQTLLPERAEQLGNLAKGIDPAEAGQKARATDEAAKAAHDKDAAAMRARVKEEVEAKKDAKKKADHEREAQNRLEIEGRKNAKESDKRTRIESLEAERNAIQDKQREFDDAMWQKMHENKQGQILQGSRSATDYYQGASRGDDPKELAKKAHDQRVETNKQLVEINRKLEKERKVIVH